MWFLNANQGKGKEWGTGQAIDVEQSDVSCAAFGMSSHR